MKFGENHSLLFYCAKYTMKHWEIEEISTWGYLKYFFRMWRGVTGSETSHIRVICPTPVKLQCILTGSMYTICYGSKFSSEVLKCHYCFYAPSLKEFTLFFATHNCVKPTLLLVTFSRNKVFHKRIYCNQNLADLVRDPLWCITRLSFRSIVGRKLRYFVCFYSWR